MLVKSVKLHNIRSYLSEQIDFPDGSLLLSGDIGSGKSSILLAVEFALFGVIRGEVDGTSLLRRGKNNGYVEVKFDIGGHEVVICRAMRRNKNSVIQSSGYIVVDGMKTECTPSELKARVLDLLGYPKSLLNKSRELIYRYTVYTPQEDMKRILFEDSSARLDTLRRVFQIESYKLIRDNASIVLHSLKERIAELSAKTEDIEERRRQLGELDGKLKSASSSLETIIPLLNDTREKIASQLELVRKHESDMKSLSNLRAEISAYEASLAEKRSSVDSARAQIESSLRQVRDLESSAASSKAASSEFAENLGILNHHISILNSDVASKNLVKSEIESLQKSLDELSGCVSKAEANIASSRRLEKNVLLSENCPVCLQPISEQHKSHFRSRISAELSESGRVIDEKGREKEAMNGRLLSARKSMDALIEKERKLAEFSVLSRQFSAQADEMAISSVAFSAKPYDISDSLRKLSSAGRLLKDSAMVQPIIKEKLSYVDSLRERVSAIEVGIAELSKRIASARVQLHGYASVDSDYALVKSRLERLQQQEKDVLVKKASLDRDIENANSGISELSSEIALKEEGLKALSRLLQLRNWMDELFISLMEVIEKNVMLKVYSEFNSLFQNWFSILMEEETISARLDDTFTPVVEVNGYDMPLESLSGGEKTSCALAYRLALNKVINDVITSIKTSDLLILDEPTDGFSSQQLEKVRDVLEQLQLPQIIIVSHESKIESFVQNVIRIVKEQHVSRITS